LHSFHNKIRGAARTELFRTETKFKTNSSWPGTWDRLGESRRIAPFARAAAPPPAAPALARWRRPQERVKKAEQNFVPVLPEPRDNAIVFPGTFTDSRQAAWFELMFIQHAFDLVIGVST
jgi:hypothetical protein